MNRFRLQINAVALNFLFIKTWKKSTNVFNIVDNKKCLFVCVYWYFYDVL